MAGELLSAALGIKMNHIPYKGENPALADTIGGQIPIMFGNLPVAVPHVKSGKLRGLANTAATRSPLAPEIPTVAESGIKGYSIATWSAVLGPAGMPPDLAARIQRDIARVVNQAETRDRLVGMGVDIIANTPEEFGAFLRAEIVRYAKVIKDAGLKAEYAASDSHAGANHDSNHRRDRTRRTGRADRRTAAQSGVARLRL